MQTLRESIQEYVTRLVEARAVIGEQLSSRVTRSGIISRLEEALACPDTTSSYTADYVDFLRKEVANLQQQVFDRDARIDALKEDFEASEAELADLKHDREADIKRIDQLSTRLENQTATIHRYIVREQETRTALGLLSAALSGNPLTDPV